MAITLREARERILEDLAAALDRVALAIACLGEAYELLDVTTAERLEAELFRPVQRAYGRGKRTHAEFARRCALPARELESPSSGPRSQGAKGFVERAATAAAEADAGIAELQDSMLPIESGDAELRTGLTEVRELLAGVPGASRQFLRTMGR
ncbi:MAG: hypothetical protein GEU88_12995 [Solirubrobacterales bacterium]|nr:hypothetical protein [Solirubrobacterales bacterium]